jgi:hypothetical protein
MFYSGEGTEGALARSVGDAFLLVDDTKDVHHVPAGEAG